jgi:phosphoribosyl-AMP cyclohydrolase
MTSPAIFPTPGTKADVEQGLVFQPRFDEHGLLPAIVTDAASGEILMFAWMNAEALALTINTRFAHFYSRSRAKLWLKGEESGNRLQVVELRTDCDQDVIALKVRIEGAGVACHTGARSCFYRIVQLGGPVGVPGGSRVKLEPAAAQSVPTQPVPAQPVVK